VQARPKRTIPKSKSPGRRNVSTATDKKGVRGGGKRVQLAFNSCTLHKRSPEDRKRLKIDKRGKEPRVATWCLSQQGGGPSRWGRKGGY